VEEQLLMDASLGIRSVESGKMLGKASFPFPFWKGGWSGMVNKVMSLILDSLRTFVARLELVDSKVELNWLLEIKMNLNHVLMNIGFWKWGAGTAWHGTVFVSGKFLVVI
jgi:hypothetical protein